jgi:hypothetical protein
MATTTGTPRAEHIGTAMLEQLADLEARSLFPETARSFLRLGFGRPHQERVDVLSEKARRGVLTPAEGEELDEFIRVGNVLAILQSKARQALKRAGLAP